jgi:hypothetical protein
MTAMIAAARSPLPLPEIGAAAFALVVPVVKEPLEVEGEAVARVLDCWTGAALVVGMVLASLFGISEARISVISI